MKFLSVLFLCFLLIACGDNITKKKFESPEIAFGSLYADASKDKIFVSDKLWADAIPVIPADLLLKEYEAAKNTVGFNLKEFVLQNFKSDSLIFANKTSQSQTLQDYAYLNLLSFVRKTKDNAGSLIPTRNPYVSGGGEFNEFSAVDGYFVYKGLEAAGRDVLCENIIVNYLQFVQDYNHVPSGNRSYKLDESPMPVLALMIDDFTQKHPERLTEYATLLTKEYQYWMSAENKQQSDTLELNKSKGFYNSIVFMDKDNVANKYILPNAKPRPQYFSNDLKLNANQIIQSKFNELSGFEINTRWQNADANNVAPVDLNAAMYKTECVLAKIYTKLGKKEYAQSFNNLAAKRKAVFDKYFWKEGFYYDFNFKTKSIIPLKTSAAFMPLLCGLASDEQTKTMVNQFKANLAGSSCIQNAENEAVLDAKLNFLAVLAFEKTNNKDLANKLKSNWLKLNESFYQKNGNIQSNYILADLNQKHQNRLDAALAFILYCK